MACKGLICNNAVVTNTQQYNDQQDYQYVQTKSRKRLNKSVSPSKNNCNVKLYSTMLCMMIAHHDFKDTHPVTKNSTSANTTKAIVNSHGWLYFICNNDNNLHIIIIIIISLIT